MKGKWIVKIISGKVNAQCPLTSRYLKNVLYSNLIGFKDAKSYNKKSQIGILYQYYTVIAHN